MSIFSRLRSLGKKKEVPLPPVELPKPPSTFESTNVENIRAKMELILTQIDSLRVQNETLGERVKNVEKIVEEILKIAKS